MTNTKLKGVHLAEVPEVEQLRACTYFGAGLCPRCYAEPLLKLRVQNSRHVHKAAPPNGLLRLGTYIEILPAHWAAFKAGEGAWDCCGATWTRPDFPKRHYFLITRGLLPPAFYEAVLADPYCVNVQVSVDILPKRTIPPKDRLAWFLAQGKTIFRFKTTPTNAAAFAALAEELGIPRSRVMETPLRQGGSLYGKDTPLQAHGWAWQGFGRCNTKCGDCKAENGVLLCAARPRALEAILGAPRGPPPRHAYEPEQVHWQAEARRCLVEHGGQCTVQEAYAWFAREHPSLEHGKGGWRFRVRVALQGVGVNVTRGSWALPRTQAPLDAYAAEVET